MTSQLHRTAIANTQVTQSLGVPRAYVRMLCELEDFLAKTLAGGRRLLAAGWRVHDVGRRRCMFTLT